MQVDLHGRILKVFRVSSSLDVFALNKMKRENIGIIIFRGIGLRIILGYDSMNGKYDLTF